MLHHTKPRLTLIHAGLNQDHIDLHLHRYKESWFHNTIIEPISYPYIGDDYTMWQHIVHDANPIRQHSSYTSHPQRNNPAPMTVQALQPHYDNIYTTPALKPYLNGAQDIKATNNTPYIEPLIYQTIDDLQHHKSVVLLLDDSPMRQYRGDSDIMIEYIDILHDGIQYINQHITPHIICISPYQLRPKYINNSSYIIYLQPLITQLLGGDSQAYIAPFHVATTAVQPLGFMGYIRTANIIDLKPLLAIIASIKGLEIIDKNIYSQHYPNHTAFTHDNGHNHIIYIRAKHPYYLAHDYSTILHHGVEKPSYYGDFGYEHHHHGFMMHHRSQHHTVTAQTINDIYRIITQ